MTLRLISCNCFDVSLINRRRAKKIRLLAKELAYLAPDLLCLQELISHRHRRYMESLLTSQGYRTVYTPNRMRTTAGGLFFASRLPIVAHYFVPYAQQGIKMSMQLGDRLLTKGCQIVRVRAHHATFTIVHTHMADVYNEHSTRQRAIHHKQLTELGAIISTLTPPLLLVGDLEERTGTSPYFRRLIKTTGLVDVTNHLPDRIQSTNTNVAYINAHSPIREEPGKYDYILASPSLQAAAAAELIFIEPSRVGRHDEHLTDHYPLDLTLNL